jgi:hypothetical protein
VLNLYGLYLRWALLTGRIDRSCHDRALESLVSYLSEHTAEKPHFGDFLSRWRLVPKPLVTVQPPLGNVVALEAP